MQLPTSYLPEKPRSAIRFMVVGFSGSVVQTWFFMAALWAMGHPDDESVLFYVAFIIGYVLEMIPNYLFTNWYTFGSHPSMKNAGGFLIARAINLPIQLVLLPILINLFPTWREDYVSMVVIFIAGCINYLICLIFFKKPNKSQLSQ